MAILIALALIGLALVVACISWAGLALLHKLEEWTER